MFTPIFLAAAYSGTLELADASEARVRATLPQSGVVTGAADVSTQLQLRGRVTDRRWEFTFGYMPLFTLTDIEQGFNPEVLHAEALGLAWHNRTVHAAVVADATFGMFNSAYLVAPAAPGPSMPGVSASPPLQLTAPPATITMFAAHPMATISVRADRRTSWSIDAGYTRSGGWDARAQATLPEQEGPIADASLSYALSRRDGLVTLVRAQAVAFSPMACAQFGLSPADFCAPQGQTVLIDEALSHLLGRATTLVVNAGGSLSWNRVQRDVPYHRAFLPDAGVSLTHRFGERGAITVHLLAQLAPIFDPLTGVMTNRAQVVASATDALNNVFELSLMTSGLQTIPPTDRFAATAVSWGVELAAHVNRQFRVAVGERAAWQTEDQIGTFFSALTYLDVTVASPTLRF